MSYPISIASNLCHYLYFCFHVQNMSAIVRNINSDLLRERSSATFNADDVTSQLYGKEEMHERRKGCEYSFIYRTQIHNYYLIMVPISFFITTTSL